MYKIAGVLFILAGCIGWGSGKIGQEKERIRHLKTLTYILGQMRGEISYGMSTLPEICLLLAELNDGCYEKCFRRIYERTQLERTAPFPEVWAAEIKSCLEGLPLKDDERRAMEELPKSLNFREEKGQAGRVGQAEAFLEDRYRQAEEACENRSKMIRSVSILTGLLLAIWLL